MTIDEVITDKIFCSRKLNTLGNNHFVAEDKWQIFFLAAAPGNPVFKDIYNGIIDIVKSYGKIYEYFTIDYIMSICYDKYEWFKKIIDENTSLEMPFNTGEISSELTSERVCRLKQTSFLKLSWKSRYPEHTNNGKQTVYGQIIESFRSNKQQST